MIAPKQPSSGSCLVGRLHDDGHTVTAAAVTGSLDPDRVLSVLRGLLEYALGDIRLMADQILANGWIHLGTPGQPAQPAPPLTEPTLVRLDLHQPSVPPQVEWLYLLGDTDASVLLYEATVHGRWAWHSRHQLTAPVDGPPPTGIGIAGDLATGHGDHEWRPATIGLAGLRTAWQAEICSTEWARGVIVARLPREVLRDVIDVTKQWHEGRLPGSGLPILALVEHVLLVLWFHGSGHEQTQQITPDVGLRSDRPDREQAWRILPDLDVHYVIGQHVLPWVLPAEEPPGYRPDELRNGVSPIQEWVTEAGLHVAYPNLREYRLPLIAAALADLAATGPAALASYDHPHRVCLVAGSYAIVVTPTSWTGRSHVTLPRPLGGTWAGDPPVSVFSSWQVATRCEILFNRNRLTSPKAVSSLETGEKVLLDGDAQPTE